MAPLLEARGLVKEYGSFTAVAGIDLTVQPGEIFGLLGPNGAGKTTTITMCVGLLRPTTGTISIDGVDLQRDPRRAKRLLGYVPDEPYLYDRLTGREFVVFMGRLYGLRGVEKGADELLAYFGLAEAASDLIAGYSHGMRQKTALCGMLIHQPRLLFLDEPTVGLDPRGARLLKDTLRALADEGRGVVLTTHILEVAEAICDRVAIVDRGRVVAQGTLRELQGTGQAESLEDIFLRLTGGEEHAPLVEALQAP